MARRIAHDDREDAFVCVTAQCRLDEFHHATRVLSAACPGATEDPPPADAMGLGRLEVEGGAAARICVRRTNGLAMPGDMQGGLMKQENLYGAPSCQSPELVEGRRRTRRAPGQTCSDARAEGRTTTDGPARNTSHGWSCEMSLSIEVQWTVHPGRISVLSRSAARARSTANRRDMCASGTVRRIRKRAM